MTPCNPGKGTINAAGTFDARAVVSLQVSLAAAPKLTEPASATTSPTGSWKAPIPAGCTTSLAPGGCAGTKLAPFSAKGAVTKGKK